MSDICKYCNMPCIKKGVRNFVQKYLCRSCNKYQQKEYNYKRCSDKNKKDIVDLTKDGSSISSISRFVGLSKSCVQREIFKAGNSINKIIYNESNEEYELDEMSLKIAGMEDIYLIYAINRRTRLVIDFYVGNRTKENINRVVTSVLNYNPKVIFTDRLNSYPSLIPKTIHKPGRRLTNRIERKNLTFRTIVKRLSRYTLCFTRKIEMLTATMNLVCWSL